MCTLKLKYEASVKDCEARKKEINHLTDEINVHECENKLNVVNAVNAAMIEQLTNKNADLVDQVKRFEKETKDLKKVVVEKDKNLHNLKKDLKNETEMCKQLKAKFNELTATVNREKKQQERKQKKREKSDFLNNLKAEPLNQNFECEICDVKTESKTQLKFHVSSTHMRDIHSQTEQNESKDVFVQTELGDMAVDKDVQTEEGKNTSETFVKYPCNYCGTNIANNYHLFEHKVKCRGTYNMRTDPGLPMPPFFPARFALPPLLQRQYRF